jgi:hypothetical protein
LRQKNRKSCKDSKHSFSCLKSEELLIVRG